MKQLNFQSIEKLETIQCVAKEFGYSFNGKMFVKIDKSNFPIRGIEYDGHSMQPVFHLSDVNYVELALLYEELDKAELMLKKISDSVGGAI